MSLSDKITYNRIWRVDIENCETPHYVLGKNIGEAVQAAEIQLEGLKIQSISLFSNTFGLKQ
jgi:hypothetical protein